MGKLNEDGLKSQLKNGALSGVYMLYGEESYLKQLYVGRIKKLVIDPAFADFNYHEYEGRRASIDDIIMDAQMLPMMSEKSLVIVHDYPLDKEKTDVDKLKEYFKDVSDTSVLVFWFDSITVDPKANAKWNSIIKAFAEAGDAVNLEKRSEAEIVKLLISYAKKRFCTLDASNARYLISVSGSDLQTLFNELEKICAYVHENEITKKDIDELAVKSLQARVFDLSRFILRGDSDSAYGILRTLFTMKEEPIGILSVISSCYTDMYRVKCAKAAGCSFDDVKNYYNYKGRDFLLSNAARNSAQISVSALRLAIDVIAEADALMKSSAVDKNILLEETVAKLLILRKQ